GPPRPEPFILRGPIALPSLPRGCATVRKSTTNDAICHISGIDPGSHGIRNECLATARFPCDNELRSFLPCQRVKERSLQKIEIPTAGGCAGLGQSRA